MSRLLDPKILMSLKNLPLAAKTTVDGFMAGIHNSNVKGVGMEFSQYRSYQAGDDLRRLDWKMFARSDRYYIRESEIETSISVKLMIDASASMKHKDGSFTKIEYARYLGASLAYLAAAQGDATGLYVLLQMNVYALSSRKDHQHLARIYHALEQIEPAGGFAEPVHYKNIFSGSGKKELLIFITDYYQVSGEITALLKALATNKHEIIVFHLMGKNEIEMNFDGYTALEDLETGEKIKLDSSGHHKEYEERLQKHLSAIRTELLDNHIFYEMMTLDQPLHTALQHFLNRRNKLKG